MYYSKFGVTGKDIYLNIVNLKKATVLFDKYNINQVKVSDKPKGALAEIVKSDKHNTMSEVLSNKIQCMYAEKDREEIYASLNPVDENGNFIRKRAIVKCEVAFGATVNINIYLNKFIEQLKKAKTAITEKPFPTPNFLFNDEWGSVYLVYDFDFTEEEQPFSDLIIEHIEGKLRESLMIDSEWLDFNPVRCDEINTRFAATKSVWNKELKETEIVIDCPEGRYPVSAGDINSKYMFIPVARNENIEKYYEMKSDSYKLDEFKKLFSFNVEDGCIVDYNKFTLNEICAACGYKTFVMSKRMFKLNYPRIMDNRDILDAMIVREKEDLCIEYEDKLKIMSFYAEAYRWLCLMFRNDNRYQTDEDGLIMLDDNGEPILLNSKKIIYDIDSVFVKHLMSINSKFKHPLFEKDILEIANNPRKVIKKADTYRNHGHFVKLANRYMYFDMAKIIEKNDLKISHKLRVKKDEPKKAKVNQCVYINRKKVRQEKINHDRIKPYTEDELKSMEKERQEKAKYNKKRKRAKIKVYKMLIGEKSVKEITDKTKMSRSYVYSVKATRAEDIINERKERARKKRLKSYTKSEKMDFINKFFDIYANIFNFKNCNDEDRTTFWVFKETFKYQARIGEKYTMLLWMLRKYIQHADMILSQMQPEFERCMEAIKDEQLNEKQLINRRVNFYVRTAGFIQALVKRFAKHNMPIPYYKKAFSMIFDASVSTYDYFVKKIRELIQINDDYIKNHLDKLVPVKGKAGHYILPGYDNKIRNVITWRSVQNIAILENIYSVSDITDFRKDWSYLFIGRNTILSTEKKLPF